MHVYAMSNYFGKLSKTVEGMQQAAYLPDTLGLLVAKLQLYTLLLVDHRVPSLQARMWLCTLYQYSSMPGYTSLLQAHPGIAALLLMHLDEEQQGLQEGCCLLRL